MSHTVNRRRRRPLLVVAAALFAAVAAVASMSLVAVPARAADETAPSEGTTLAKEWSAALEAGHVEWMEPHLSADYIYVNPLGKTVNGETLLRTLKGKKLNFKIEPKEREFRVHGDAVVIVGKCHITGEIDGRKLDGDYRYMDVFKKHEGRWVAIASTMTAIAKPS